jgi:hypothetical protein
MARGVGASAASAVLQKKAGSKAAGERKTDMQVSLSLKRPGLVREGTVGELESYPYAGIIRIRFTGFVREDISGPEATP